MICPGRPARVRPPLDVSAASISAGTQCQSPPIRFRRQMVLLATFLLATAVGIWVLWGPIAWRAVRTGKLLGRGVVYDRGATPKRYWVGLLGLFGIAPLMTGMAVWYTAFALPRLALPASNCGSTDGAHRLAVRMGARPRGHRATPAHHKGREC